MNNFRPFLVTVAAGFLMFANSSFATDGTEVSAPVNAPQSDDRDSSSLGGVLWDTIEEYFWSRCDPDCESEVIT